MHTSDTHSTRALSVIHTHARILHTSYILIYDRHTYVHAWMAHGMAYGTAYGGTCNGMWDARWVADAGGIAETRRHVTV